MTHFTSSTDACIMILDYLYQHQVEEINPQHAFINAVVGADNTSTHLSTANASKRSRCARYLYILACFSFPDFSFQDGALQRDQQPGGVGEDESANSSVQCSGEAADTESTAERWAHSRCVMSVQLSGYRASALPTA